MAYTASLDTVNTLLGADLEEIKDWLGEAGSSNDNVITDLVNEASWFFNRACNRLFLSRSVTEYHDGRGGVILWLDNPPVTGLTLYEDPDYSFGSSTVISSSYYNLDTETGRIYLTGYVFDHGRGIIKATYTGGYADASLPMDLRMAAKARVSRMYQLWKSNAHATTSRSDDSGGQTGYMHEESPIEKAVVAKYRKVVAI